jgi:hypothetical protein
MEYSDSECNGETLDKILMCKWFEITSEFQGAVTGTVFTKNDGSKNGCRHDMQSGS